MKSFYNLTVWQQAHELALLIYKATRVFPKDEIYGLTSQIRRASTSIPANIAEGCGRHGDAELSRFLSIAMGSASELEYHLLLAKDLAYLDATEYQDLSSRVTDIKRMLASLIKKVRSQD